MTTPYRLPRSTPAPTTADATQQTAQEQTAAEMPWYDQQQNDLATTDQGLNQQGFQVPATGAAPTPTYQQQLLNMTPEQLAQQTLQQRMTEAQQQQQPRTDLASTDQGLNQQGFQAPAASTWQTNPAYAQYRTALDTAIQAAGQSGDWTQAQQVIGSLPADAQQSFNTYVSGTMQPKPTTQPTATAQPTATGTTPAATATGATPQVSQMPWYQAEQKQQASFLPSATTTANKLPGGAAGAPTFGSDEDLLWKKAASSVWNTPTATKAA
jgi:hypothetical protein